MHCACRCMELSLSVKVPVLSVKLFSLCELQVETVDASPGIRDGSGNYTAVQRYVTTSNGRMSQSNRLSGHRRSRLQAASATPRSEDLNTIGDLKLSRDDVQTLLLNVNGDQSACVEKETTC